jgi:hypothetical protein
MRSRTTAWSVILAVLVTFAFTTTVRTQGPQNASHDQRDKDRGNGVQRDQWVIMTYVPADNCNVPVPLPVTKVKGGGVSFLMPNSSYCSPDRAMLLTNRLPKGTLIGHSLSAQMAILAVPGTTFSYWDATLGPQPGGFVRLYIQGTNPDLIGCLPGWHPERPDCEAQYWWSNPVYIDLAHLALFGSTGFTMQEVLNPAYWSDRDGHMGNTPAGDFGGHDADGNPTPQIWVDHAAAFQAAVDHATKTGLSFGGGGSWAFGVGSDPPAKFLLYDFKIQ